MTTNWPTHKIGAQPASHGGVVYTLWAPNAQKARIKVAHQKEYTATMQTRGHGYFEHICADSSAGSLYSFALDDSPNFLPDPASRAQPHGVHGPSAVVFSDYEWTDHEWSGLDYDELVIYELHVGTYSQEGTFEGLTAYLEELQGLGVTAIELMPLAQFPGKRNWGYDGVFPFAVQDSYGGAAGLKMLVNRCHELGLGVILDVIYNHLGPEGNYLGHYGPYFQDRYKTPWGGAINFDSAHSDEVRRFFIENALQWLDEFHIDALRLDAIHAICDLSATPFLEELATAVDELAARKGRPFYLIAESDTNDSRILMPRSQSGVGLYAQWCDDFHHSLHALATGERFGYYQDYGSLEMMAKALGQGVVFDGQYSPFRHAHHGRSYRGVDRSRLVICIQNHDQVGNRACGERLSQLLDFQRLKTVAACVLLSPFTPLLFMGEEYGEENPFLYFVDHTDKELLEAVRKGRAEEFKEAHAAAAPPDPGSPETFSRSRLNHASKKTSLAAQNLWRYYQRLIELSKWIRKEKIFTGDGYRSQADLSKQVICTRGENAWGSLHCYFSFNTEPVEVKLPSPVSGQILLSSADYRADTPLPTLERQDARYDNALTLRPFEVLAVWME